MRAAFRDHPGDEDFERAKRAEFVPADYQNQIQITEIFSRPAPLEVDIGTGEGAFLEAMAQRHPERNFLGMERLLGRVRKVCRRLAAARLENARMMRIDCVYAMHRLMPPASIAVAHIAFPDPWPNHEDRRRRLVRDQFLEALHTALEPGGEVRVKTDNAVYFQSMERVFSRAVGFQRAEWVDSDALTNFEQRFLSLGVPIYKARLIKV